MYCLQEITCPSNDSTNGTSSEKSLDGLSSSLLLSGMELFGPLYVKLGGRTGKRWRCLLTCRKKSAVQLELVPSTDIDDFRMCFRRFIYRRGMVVQLRRVRGSNFVGGERELTFEVSNSGTSIRLSANSFSEGLNGVFSHLLFQAIVLKSIMGTLMITEAVLETLLT